MNKNFTKALVALFALAVCASAQAETKLAYDLLFDGKKSGEMTTVIRDDGRLHVTFTYRNNGRGPDIEEDIALRPDGSFKSYRQRGRATFGAALDERFEISGDRATWRSPTERGQQSLTGPAVYLPMDGSPETSAIIVRATQKAGGRLQALPGGTLRSEKLADARVGPEGSEREVALFAIIGAGLQPNYVWLDADGDMRLFALVVPGYAHLVVPGYESVVAELERLQVEAETRHLADIAKKSAQTLPQPILIRNVRVFDARKKAIGAPADVYVNDGRIAAIYQADSPAQDPATVIEGAGRTLLPGLFDMHTHEDAWNSILQIAGGVTSSRDMGNDNDYLDALRADIAAGRAIGPHIEPAGFIEGESDFSASGGFVVSSVAEAEDAVDWYAERGFRQVKLYNSIKPEWAQPIAAYAHSRGLRVSGHVPAFSRAVRVVREGYDELQHINQLMLNFVSDPDTDSRTIVRFNLVGERTRDLDLDSPAVREFIALLAERGTVIDATMATFEGSWNQKPGDMNPSMAPVAEHLPIASQRDWRNNETDVSGGKLETYRASWKRMMEFLGRLHSAGVPLVAGTDDLAGFMLHRELELYVQAGVAPAEAIRIATENGARYSGVLADRGTVERGKRADLILVDGDPTADISAIRRIAYVLKDGVGYAPAEIYEAFGVRRFTDPPRITRRESKAPPPQKS
jgi:Amidohydrolase family